MNAYGRKLSGSALERSKRDKATREQANRQRPSAPFENVRPVGTQPRRLARPAEGEASPGPINPRVTFDGVPVTRSRPRYEQSEA